MADGAYRLLHARLDAKDAALKEIAAIADAAIWMEGQNRIYMTIRRKARKAITHE